MFEITQKKCRLNPTEGVSFLFLALNGRTEKHRTIHQQPRASHSRRRRNKTKKGNQPNKQNEHITECTKATHDSLTPWHSFGNEKNGGGKKKDALIALQMAERSTPQRTNRVARFSVFCHVCAVPSSITNGGYGGDYQPSRTFSLDGVTLLLFFPL